MISARVTYDGGHFSHRYANHAPRWQFMTWARQIIQLLIVSLPEIVLENLILSGAINGTLAATAEEQARAAAGYRKTAGHDSGRLH